MRRFFIIHVFVVYYLLLCFGVAESSLKKPEALIAVDGGRIFILDDKGINEYDAHGKFLMTVNEKVYDIAAVSGTKDIVVGKWIGRKITELDIVRFAKYFRVKPRLSEVIDKVFYPECISFGPNNKIYAIGEDIYRQRGVVALIDPNDGHTIAVYKLGADEERKDMYPTGIAVNKHGEIYVADYAQSCVYQLGRDGKLIRKWGGYGNKNGQFKQVWGIAVDQRTDDVYVSDIFFARSDKPWDYPQRRIQVFSRDGKFRRKWGGNKIEGVIWYPLRWDMRSELGDVVDIAINSRGDVYLLEKNRHKVSKYMDGKKIMEWGKLGKGPGEFNWPEGICIDKDDNIYVADTGNDRVQKFDPSGKFLMEIK